MGAHRGFPGAIAGRTSSATATLGRVDSVAVGDPLLPGIPPPAPGAALLLGVPADHSAADRISARPGKRLPLHSFHRLGDVCGDRVRRCRRSGRGVSGGRTGLRARRQTAVAGNPVDRLRVVMGARERLPEAQVREAVDGADREPDVRRRSAAPIVAAAGAPAQFRRVPAGSVRGLGHGIHYRVVLPGSLAEYQAPAKDAAFG